MKIKKRQFGRVVAFDYKSGTSKLLPGISLIPHDIDGDEFTGEWMRLKEARKLVKDLTSAIKYIDKCRGKKEPKG